MFGVGAGFEEVDEEAFDGVEDVLGGGGGVVCVVLVEVGLALVGGAATLVEVGLVLVGGGATLVEVGFVLIETGLTLVGVDVVGAGAGTVTYTVVVRGTANVQFLANEVASAKNVFVWHVGFSPLLVQEAEPVIVDSTMYGPPLFTVSTQLHDVTGFGVTATAGASAATPPRRRAAKKIV